MDWKVSDQQSIFEASFGPRLAAADWLQAPTGPWKDHGTFQHKCAAMREIVEEPSRMACFVLEEMELFCSGEIDNIDKLDPHLEMMSSQICSNSPAVSASCCDLATSSSIGVRKEQEWL
jgi:hypothetical protein